ncbi:MAG TPA: hypothetical protein VF593_10350 [Chthoniobacteraceae bacterium]|jgi:uncharacterized protein YacL
MTPHRTVNLLRALFVTFTMVVGLMIGSDLLGSGLAKDAAGSGLIGAMIGAAFGLTVVLADRLMHGVTLRVFSSATFGLLIGFIFAQLLLSSRVLATAPGQVQWIVGLVVYSTFGYLGMMLAIRSNRDEFSVIIPYVRFRRAAVQDAPLLIDGSVILDGRIAEICATGFLSSSLVIPRFVLDELQRMADSGEAVKCERGRAALDRVALLQRNAALSVTIHEGDADSDVPSDTRLIKLANILDARLLTTEGHLSSIARLQNVAVLNLQDLGRALSPVFTAGDEPELALIKEGRDLHQAVGYLPDGTMVVVNHARSHLGKTMRVVIGSSLQTTAGRLFFAELKHAA